MGKCDLRITFDRSDRVYRTGEKVTGAVEVRVNEECRCDRLWLTREWRTHGKGNRTSGAAGEITLFQGSWLPGEAYSFEFSFDAPNGPLTHHGHYVNVDWYLQARADIPWAIDPKAEEEFLLVSGESKEGLNLGPEYKRPEQAPVKTTAVGCGLFFALIFVSIGIAVMIGGFSALLSGGPQGIFMIPFGAAFSGIACYLTYNVVRNMLAQRTLGRVDVVFETRVARRGQTLDLTVRFEPRQEATLARAMMKLVGRERAISGSGTNQTTHIHGLHQEERLLDPGRPLQPGQLVVLKAPIPIPQDAPITFSARSNYVEWLVEIHLDVPGRPDWVQEYPITVAP